jgi:outer membrane protein assembly factor BamA
LKLKGTRYNEGLAGATTPNYLLSPYIAEGYLDAKLTSIHSTVSATTPEMVDVDVTVTIDEGGQYRVASLDFAGTPIAPATILTATPKLHPGDIASHKALLATLAPVDAAYRRLGYMDVVVQPGAVLDTAAHKVGYNVTVIPGEQYRLRSVNVVGLNLAARADFDRGWQMKAGDLYNPEYVANFLKNNTALQALAVYSAGFKTSADPQTHQVDLTLTFVRAGAR